MYSPQGPCTSSTDKEYRYGPSIIINDDDSIDVWFCSPGDGGSQWDWVRYNHSTDGGTSWRYSWASHKTTNMPHVALVPSPVPSADRFSCCDPGAIKFGGYYYLGYTSTSTGNGKCNRFLSPSHGSGRAVREVEWLWLGRF